MFGSDPQAAGRIEMQAARSRAGFVRAAHCLDLARAVPVEPVLQASHPNLARRVLGKAGHRVVEAAGTGLAEGAPLLGHWVAMDQMVMHESGEGGPNPAARVLEHAKNVRLRAAERAGANHGRLRARQRGGMGGGKGRQTAAGGKPPIARLRVQGDLRPGPREIRAAGEPRPLRLEGIPPIEAAQGQHPLGPAHRDQFAVAVFQNLLDAWKRQPVGFAEVGEPAVDGHHQSRSVRANPKRPGPVHQERLHGRVLDPGQFGMCFHPSAIADPRQPAKRACPEMALPEGQGAGVQARQPVLRGPDPVDHGAAIRIGAGEPEDTPLGAHMDFSIGPLGDRDAAVVQQSVIGTGVSFHGAIAPKAVDATVGCGPDIAETVLEESLHPRLMPRHARLDLGNHPPRGAGIAAVGAPVGRHPQPPP